MTTSNVCNFCPAFVNHKCAMGHELKKNQQGLLVWISPVTDVCNEKPKGRQQSQEMKDASNRG